jgi:hypothetical protein
MVTQCKEYAGVGETMVCHRSVRIARIAAIDQTALTGGAIGRRTFTIRIDDISMVTKTATVVDEMGL